MRTPLCLLLYRTVLYCASARCLNNRIAIEQQAALVPVLALGETLQLRNLYDVPSLQQYTYKRLGFPGGGCCSCAVLRYAVPLGYARAA